MNSYQLGTLAFSAGTAVWGAEVWAAGGGLDPAALVYALGCLLFADDAFKLRTRLGRAPSTLRSYQAGSVAYALGTATWGLAAYRDTGAVDVAAALYGIGCVYFLLDAFGAAMPPALRLLRLSNQQLGSVVFLAGTVVWGVTGGVSIPVAAYGLGCLFFVQDAFRARLPATAGAGAAPA